ncbi:MAG: hypothetical protein AAF242_17510 [Bacteroidota bacterium]
MSSPTAGWTNDLTTAFNMRILILVLILSSSNLWSQQDLTTSFQPLLNKTWIASGQWGDGSAFEQTIHFKAAVEGQVILTESYGFIDQEQKKKGHRNHGIRKIDPETGALVFWEFDVFGGVTTGNLEVKDKDFIYQYQYGETMVTDYWEYIDYQTYNFKVGQFEDGEWKQVYLTTQFKEKITSLAEQGFILLRDHIVGKWASPAWDGTLVETWQLDANGHITQSATYYEEDQILYQANNKIEIVAGELLLFTVIENSNPKIFKATMMTPTSITFENSEYSNPNKVVYQFEDEDAFQRTISGVEEGAPTSYTFQFKRKR